MFIILFITFVLLTLIFLNGKYNEYYWKKRGVVFDNRNRVMGPIWDFLTQNRPLFQIFHDIYKKYDEPVIGIGSFLTPALYVKDVRNIQHVLQDDFQSFNHRAVDIYKKDLLADNILFMNGVRWRMMRQNLSPLFTAAKLKNMYYIIDKGAQDFVELLKSNPEKLKGNAFDSLTTYCSAAIGAAVFGITAESIFDSPFLQMTRKAAKQTTSRNLKFTVGNIAPAMMDFLHLKVFGEHEEFFIGAIKKIIRQREKDGVKKHDFADICVSLQRRGNMVDPETGAELAPTDELLAAQAFFFFLAGVEPTATAMFCTLIELGRHEDVLRRVQREIDETFARCGELSYDEVSGMEYLDRVVNEALRMYPPIGVLTRRCVRDSVLPTGVHVQAGTKVFTPVYELHHDPNHYPSPETFDPERFEGSRPGGVLYQPFGAGGRACLGRRYAQLQVKAGLAHLLRRYSVRAHVGEGGVTFSKQQVQVRPDNVDLELVLRAENESV